MGTRNLTAVQLDGEYKIAQYGQWDGYPSGQGATVLEFLNSLNKSKKKQAQFKARLRKAQWGDDAHFAKVESKENWPQFYPELSRDTGAKILHLVLNSPPGIKLCNAIDFAGDSLFCEWAYVIDLDAGLLEVYKGFNKRPLAKTARFHGAPRESSTSVYYPIRKKATFPLDDLPTVKQMEKKCGR